MEFALRLIRGVESQRWPVDVRLPPGEVVCGRTGELLAKTVQTRLVPGGTPYPSAYHSEPAPGVDGHRPEFGLQKRLFSWVVATMRGNDAGGTRRMNKQDANLVPTQPAGTDRDSAIEPTGAPEEFGFPVNPNVRQLRCWRNQELFLAEFAKCGIISHAAEAAGVTVANVEWWDSQDTYGFKRRKTWAAQVALGYAEMEVRRRAIEGVDKPIVYKGQITKDSDGTPVTIKEYSDNLLMFLTKKLDPAYRDNYAAPAQDNRQVHITYNLHPDADLSRLPTPPEHHFIEGSPPADRALPEEDQK